MTNKDYLQRNGFLKQNQIYNMMIPVTFFYICSVLWIISYYMLLTTDITSHYYIEDE